MSRAAVTNTANGTTPNPEPIVDHGIYADATSAEEGVGGNATNIGSVASSSTSQLESSQESPPNQNTSEQGNTISREDALLLFSSAINAFNTPLDAGKRKISLIVDRGTWDDDVSYQK
jgi:hypothetical protein